MSKELVDFYLENLEYIRGINLTIILYEESHGENSKVAEFQLRQLRDIRRRTIIRINSKKYQESFFIL